MMLAYFINMKIVFNYDPLSPPTNQLGIRKEEMKLKDQVISLDLAKKMKELGFKQESFFYWEVYDGPINTPELVTQTYPKTVQHNMDYFSAYTVVELGEMLKDVWEIMAGADRHELTTTIDGSNKPYKLWYQSEVGYREESELKGSYVEAETEANARADILIYLKENNLL
jgi:hypothetical protein